MFSYSTPLLTTLKTVKFRITGLAVIRHKEMPDNINVKAGSFRRDAGGERALENL